MAEPGIVSVVREPKISTVTLNVEQFQLMLSLGRRKPWLAPRTEAIHSLLAECEKDSQMKLVLDLLERFEFLSGDQLEGALDTIAKTIVETWGLDPANTRLFAASNDQEADGSQALLNALKAPFAPYGGWTAAGNFVNSLLNFEDHLEGVENIVLVDDFIGTGRTVNRRVEWIRKKLAELGRNAHVYVCTLAAMKFSQPLLTKAGLQCFASIWLGKALSDHFKGEDLVSALGDMDLMEQQLARMANGAKLARFRLGFDRSEAIFSAQGYNVPNNVLPIFWWSKSVSGPRKPLLPRLT